MSEFKLKIRKEIAAIELANNNPCNSLDTTAKATGTVLLGSTGGGKTTLMEFLLNKNLTIGIRYGNSYLDSKSNHIGHGGEAKTDQVMIYTYDKNQIFIDTPGFGDTRGEYTEIKNHIAIRNIVECDKIMGIRMVFVVPKSFIFYEANRGTDLIKFVKAIRNFIPDFSAKKWIDQTLIIVTKTETRTTTNNAIEAIKDGIEQIREIREAGTIITKEEREFFQHLTDNQRVKLFPMPPEPYQAGTIFENPELRKDILDFIKKVPVVKVSKDDFKKDFELLSAGVIIGDINHERANFINQAQIIEENLKKNIKQYIKSFPKGNLSTTEYKKTKKILEEHIKDKTICNQQEIEVAFDIAKQLVNVSSPNPFKDTSVDFGEVNELKSTFCELDYSVKFLQKYISHKNDLFQIEAAEEKLTNIIEQVITYFDWVICTTNAYATFFRFLIQKDNQSQPKDIDTILNQNVNGYKFFGHNTEDIRNSIFDICTKSDNVEIAKNNKRKLVDLRDSNVNDNALDKLVLLISSILKDEYPLYDKSTCTIKGFMPGVSQINMDHNALDGCTTIAIYGVYGIQINGPLELPGKNLIMIAPHIKVSENQKIKLDGQDAANHLEIEDNNGQHGAAGNLGRSAGSFYGYCIEKSGGKLIISAKGGNGGNGQNGAKGVNGAKGNPASKNNLLDSKLYSEGSSIELKSKEDHQNWSWSRHIRCTDTGKDGSTGGIGGTGGEGGHGGLAGSVDFQIKNAKMDKEKYFSSITAEGTKGKNGAPGDGGKGGAHGDALCYLVDYPDSAWSWVKSPPKAVLHKKIDLPIKNEDTYGLMKYPSLSVHENALNGSKGSPNPVHKSQKTTLRNESIKKKEYINKYIDFISQVQNIKDLIIQEDANGKSLHSDNQEILEFFTHLRSEECSVNGCQFD